MDLYRIDLRPRGPWLTPWHADTIAGSLCWQLRRQAGEAALGELLERCRAGQPPFVLSDAFPADHLPRPLCVFRLIRRLSDQDALAQAQADGARRDVGATCPVCRATSPPPATPQEARFRLDRAWRRRELIPQADFEHIRAGRLPPCAAQGTDSPLKAPEHPFRAVARLHATVDRRTGTSLQEGGLREEEETWLDPRVGHLTIYARVQPDWTAQLENLFRALAAAGFGKKKSSGMGAFTLVSFARCNDFAPCPQANAFISLSHFAPAAADPTEGDYGLIVKHGRLGEEFALGEQPFKRPLVLLVPGSCLRTGGAPREWYGRAVAGLAPGQPGVLQLAFALALPMRFPEA